MGFLGGSNGKEPTTKSNAGDSGSSHWVVILGRADLLEKGITTHSSILA